MLSLDPAKRPSTGELLDCITERVVNQRATTDSPGRRGSVSRSAQCVNCRKKVALIEQLTAQIKDKDGTIKELHDAVSELQDKIRRMKRREKRRKRKETKEK